MMQMRKLIFQVLGEFDLEWAANVPDWQLQHYWLTEQHGLQVRVDCKVGRQLTSLNGSFAVTA